MENTNPVTRRSNAPEMPTLDDVHRDTLVIRRKLLGLAKLFSKAATDESGTLDIDEASIGVSEIIEDISEKLDELASSISEHAVRK